MLERLPYDYAIRFQAVFHSNSNFKKKIQLKRDQQNGRQSFQAIYLIEDKVLLVYKKGERKGERGRGREGRRKQMTQ